MLWGRLFKSVKDFCNTVRTLCSYSNFEPETKTDKRRAYVVFVPVGIVGTLYWIHTCLKKEFAHCMVFWDTPNGILRANSTANVVDISYMKKDFTVERFVKNLKRNKCKVLKCDIVPRARANEYLPLKLNPQNCVSLSKQLLGVSPKRVFTPYQLYLWLVNQVDIEEL